MPFHKEMKHVAYYMGKAAHGGDLLEEITALCAAKGVTLGRVEALGALKKARLGYYDQNAREYRFLEINEPLEITGLIGNVSVKDGKPLVHAHVTLSDREHRAYGGHLGPGCEVFACEFVLQVFDGPQLTRGFDQQTGLPLWDEG